jgi:rare lipoprotein A
MQYGLKRVLVISLAGLLASGCGGAGGKDRPKAGPEYVDDAPPAMAEPQMAAGPVEANAQYDEVGYASWYGDELRGNPTAMGEPFNPDGMTAAHPSLPLPSFAEITHLGTGKTIIVRINDRGPSVRGRIVDLSRGAATALGAAEQGAFAVRVRRVNPPEDEKMALASGGKGAGRLDTPETLLIVLRRKLGTGPAPVIAQQPPVAVRPAAPQPPRTVRPGANYDQPVAPRPVQPSQPGIDGDDGYIIEEAGRAPSRPAQGISGGYYIQVAAFSSEARAQSAARSVGGTVQRAGSVWRVRKGPYVSESAARENLGAVAAKGYRDARVTR